MNIFRALMVQHDLVERLSADLCKASEHHDGSVRAILAELSLELRRHFELEERLFYATVTPSLILVNAGRFLAEHQKLLDLLEKAATLQDKDDFAQNVKALENALVQHAGDEEIELFPEVKRRFDRHALEGMGELYQRAVLGDFTWEALPAGG